MSNHRLYFYLLKPFMMVVLICSLIITETEGRIVSTRDSKLFLLETSTKTDEDSNLSSWNSFLRNEKSNDRTRRESAPWSELMDTLERFPNTTDNQGNTLIHFFVIKKCSYCVTRLLARFVDPNIKNHAGQTALNLAKTLQKEYPTNEELIKIIHQLEDNFITSCPVDILSLELNKTIISKTIDSKMGLELVEKGLRFLRGHQNFDDKIVLVLGNRGIQKDMLIPFITDNLKSSDLPNKTRNNNEESPIPKFFFDTKTNTKFYEIPDFCNSFKKHEDIYVQFFLKNILENAKQVKFLLTATQDSLENIEDYLICFDSVIRLMPNIKQYMESISLVVTNVDVDSFSTILELLLKIQHNELMKIYPNPAIIELLSNILEKDSSDNSFVHLGLVKNPDTCGQLNNSLIALAKNREDVHNLVFDRTAFIRIDQFDFQYSIQEDAEIEIVALKKATISRIRSKFTTWFESLKEKYETNLQEIQDIQEKKFILNKHEIFFNKFRVSLDSHQNLKQILSSLMDFSFNIKVPLQTEILGCIWDLNEFLEFLSLVSTYDEQSLFWGKELIDFLDFFNNIRNWYIFVNKTYKTLSSFKIQSEKSLYQTKPKFEPNTTLSSFNLTLLQEISGFSNVGSLIMNSEMCSEMNMVFEHTLNKANNYSLRSNGIWRIEANFILISEILHTLIERKESAEILAFDTIYIDEDINLSETNKNLVILAPKWVIQGDRLINLNNAKLGEGTLNSSNKIESGQSGFLFETSSKFFGFGEKILNVKNLKITSNHHDHGSIERLISGYPNVAKYKTIFLAEYQENYLTSKIVLDMITNVAKDDRNILETRINDLRIELIDIENLHSTQTLDGKFFVSLYESLILKIIRYSSEIKITENELRFKQLLANLLTISSLRLHEAKNNKKQDISTTTTLQNIRNDITALKEFSNVEELLTFVDLVLDIISDIETELKGLSSSSIEQVVKDLINSVNWYSFQIQAFEMLSSYEIQLTKQFYLGVYPKFEPEIDFSYYELPLAGISKVNKKMSIELNTLVDHTSKSEIQVTIKNSIVQIKGNFIIVSRILQYVTGQNKSVELFAFDTIYIDADIELYEGRDLAIISPKWVIKDKRYIQMNGKAGEDYAGQQAPNSSSKTQSEKNGRVGIFGGDAGNFLGFGEVFENAVNLYVQSNGGKGGSGEKGGDGFDGKISGIVDIEIWKEIRVPLDKFHNIKKNNIVIYERYEKSDKTNSAIDCFGKYMVNRNYKFFGSEGWAGTSGGEGGPGGGGGNPGYIFVSFKSSDMIKYTTEKGSDGVPGRGGKAGRPGSSKPNEEKCKVLICDGHWTYKFEDCQRKVYKLIGGIYGQNGTEVTSKPTMSRSELAKMSYQSLINYKISLLDDMQEENRLNIEAILSLVRSIDSDSLRLDLFTTSDLCTELLELEKSYLNTYHLKLQKTVYLNFISKINTYASNPNPVEKSPQFKKVLAFLFTAAYSRVHGNNLKPNVVTDIQSYFKLLKEKIQRLRDLKNYEEKLSIINQTLSEYKEPMDQKIDSGIKLIKTRILPQIDYINKQLDKTMELLVDEVVELKKQAEIQRDQLLAKEEELRSTASLRSLFSVLKVVGQAASFLGPKGKAVGALISGASSITESFVLDQKAGSFQQMQTQFKGLGQFSKGFQSSINSYTNKKINDLSLKIEKLAPATIEYPSLADLNSDIKQYKIDLDEIKKAREQPGANPYSYQNKVDELEDKLASRLDEKEQELLYKEVEGLEEKQKKNRENGAEVIRQVNNVVQMAELGVDIHHKHQKDKEAIQQVSKEIAKISKIIKGHEEFKKQIYSYMIPQLDNMKLINEKVIEGLSDLNQIELSVKKWEVQSHVKQMILKLKKFTKGSDLQGDFLHIMEELQDGLGVIVEVYDKIEEYQEQKQMFDFMALLASPASQQISITDKELSPQVSKLEYIIQANLLISLFNHGMGSFRQWVFPFGHRYLDQFNLPRSLILQKDFNDLVDQVVEKVTKVSEIIDILKSTISTPDNDITSGIFNSQIVSQGPFYVWDYDEWKENILDLVSGIDVIFKADVRKIPFAKNALKLSVIEINFNCTNCNEEIKSELDHELKYFSVNMTHGGNSFYKCGEKYFIVRGESTISIKQSFEFHEKKRVLVNQVSSKLALGDCQLSPYTSWTFQIFSDRRRPFDKLKEIFNDHKINLELVGEGKYVLDGVDFSKLYLETYYEQVE